MKLLKGSLEGNFGRETFLIREGFPGLIWRDPFDNRVNTVSERAVCPGHQRSRSGQQSPGPGQQKDTWAGQRKACPGQQKCGPQQEQKRRAAWPVRLARPGTAGTTSVVGVASAPGAVGETCGLGAAGAGAHRRYLAGPEKLAEKLAEQLG